MVLAHVGAGHAHLEVVRPGHVRHRGPRGVVRPVVALSVDGRRVRAEPHERVDVDALTRSDPAHRCRWRGPLPAADPGLPAKGRMNEIPASNSSRLLAGMVQDACVAADVADVVVHRGVVVDNAEYRPELAQTVALVGMRHRDLVALARLPRQADAVVARGALLLRGPVEVGLVERPAVRLVARRPVVEAPRRVGLRSPPAMRRVEPQPVANDRPAEADAPVPVLLSPRIWRSSSPRAWSAWSQFRFCMFSFAPLAIP